MAKIQKGSRYRRSQVILLVMLGVLFVNYFNQMLRCSTGVSTQIKIFSYFSSFSNKIQQKYKTSNAHVSRIADTKIVSSVKSTTMSPSTKLSVNPSTTSTMLNFSTNLMSTTIFGKAVHPTTIAPPAVMRSSCHPWGNNQFPRDSSKLNFTYSIFPLFTRTKYDDYPILLVLVNSEVTRFKNRMLIRNTWGSEKWQTEFKTRLFFLVAKSNDTESSVQSNVLEESNKFGDLIQGDFHDTYHDMVRKTGMGYHWVITQCLEQKIPFILKTDDDMFINVQKVVQTIANNRERNTWGNTAIVCFYFYNMDPARQKDSKWYIPENEYPNKKLPIFCRGSFVIIAGGLLKIFYETAFHSRYIWLEDAFWFGLVPKSIRVTSVQRIFWNRHGYYGQKDGANKMFRERNYLWYSHKLKEYEFLLLFRWFDHNYGLPEVLNDLSNLKMRTNQSTPISTRQDMTRNI